jgi:hypothetical protein
MHNYDSSGNVTIIIKALHPVSLLGVNYESGDVIAVFDNAYFELNFINNNKQATQSVRTMMNYNTMAVDKIVIEPKSLTHTAYNFIAGKFIKNGDVLVPVKEDKNTDENGSLFFNYIPVNTKTVFIKNQHRENLTGYTVDYETGMVTNLPANTSVIIFYYKKEERLSGYVLNEVSTPYFMIEILGQNNINNVSREMLMTIPKASIDIATVLEFKEEHITAMELEFIIIDSLATIDYY